MENDAQGSKEQAMRYYILPPKRAVRGFERHLPLSLVPYREDLQTCSADTPSWRTYQLIQALSAGIWHGDIQPYADKQSVPLGTSTLDWALDRLPGMHVRSAALPLGASNNHCARGAYQYSLTVTL